MPRRRNPERPPVVPAPAEAPQPPTPPSKPLLSRTRTALLVVLLLLIHYALAAHSLRQENPTVDEVAHLPAGVTYWQKGTFRLYHHNPPLAKLVAALPVVLASPETGPLYRMNSWTEDPPSQATFAQSFAYLNAPRYFELFTAARMVMPLFSIVGGLFVFAWSGRLYGRVGGLLSLALWCLCPNILAHARLITSDVAGASMGVGATYVFWRYLRNPSWRWAVVAGLALGLAQLTKFSLLLLYGYWPLLWAARLALVRDFAGWPGRLGRDVAQGMTVVAISLLLICAGYGFEGVGNSLGSYNFTSRTLTRPRGPAVTLAPDQLGPNWIAQLARLNRINRFRGTWLERIPAPLPSHFLIGFDDQRIETEGVPRIWFEPDAKPGETTGYSVYLDGTLRPTGWWYYYPACLAYKVPEGTWIVVLLSGVALVMVRKTRQGWFDEFAVLAFPAIVLVAMSALTDINLGLRYILPVFPFVFIAAGKVAPWVGSMRGRWRGAMTGVVAVAAGLTALQTALVHPSYLASFNWLAGGPVRGSEHLIDSNLDWGQDLVTLRRWLAANRPGRTVGLAYFGQINPGIFTLRGDDFAWFLPPTLPGTAFDMKARGVARPSLPLRPGVYAVSASLVKGLGWRVYDAGDPRTSWGPAYNAQNGAFAYFADLAPVARIGGSIFVYDVTEEDCARINPRLDAKGGRPATPPANPPGAPLDLGFRSTPPPEGTPPRPGGSRGGGVEGDLPLVAGMGDGLPPRRLRNREGHPSISAGHA